MTWDLQTGGVVSQGRLASPLVAYSTYGTMFGVLSLDHTPTISTYDTPSGTRICSHSVEGSALHQIWTHGDCLRFATINSQSVTTWEVAFGSTDAPAEVGSLCIPDGFHSPIIFLLHPALPRLVFTAEERLLVWDAQHSKLLLDFADIGNCIETDFSPDGRLFACKTSHSELYLWKESPTGYILHQKLIFGSGGLGLLISPNGESVITSDCLTIQRWRTTDSNTSPSVVPTQSSRRDLGAFILGFSPDETLAAVTQCGDEMVTVLDLKSGVPRMTIDTGTKVFGVGMARSAVVVVGDGKIVTWNVPAGDCVLDPRLNINDSVRTTVFDPPTLDIWASQPTTSVSPDLRRIVIMELDQFGILATHLHLYEVHTGQRIISVCESTLRSPQFTPDGCEVWCFSNGNEAVRWKIVESSESNATGLECLGKDGLPFQPSRGYKVTDNGWILNSSGKRVLWLPSHWYSQDWRRMWRGWFLALLHPELSEVVILELPEE